MPWEFRALDERKKSELIALSETLNDMAKWEAHIDAIEAEKASKKGKKS